MLKFAPRQFLMLLGCLSLVGLTVAAAAPASCGGGGEEAEVKLTAGTFHVNETRSVTIDNPTETEFTVTAEHTAGPNFEKKGSACGTVAATSSCSSRQFKCLASSEMKYAITVGAVVYAEIYLKCD